MDFGIARSMTERGTGGRRPARATARRRRRRRPDHARQRGRHHRVHGARTGAGEAGRSARRHLRLRPDPVRPAARPDARPRAQQRVRRSSTSRMRETPPPARTNRSRPSPRRWTASSRSASSPTPGRGMRPPRSWSPRSTSWTRTASRCHRAAAHPADGADVGARRGRTARADLVARARRRRRRSRTNRCPC